MIELEVHFELKAEVEGVTDVLTHRVMKDVCDVVALVQTVSVLRADID